MSKSESVFAPDELLVDLEAILLDAEEKAAKARSDIMHSHHLYYYFPRFEKRWLVDYDYLIIQIKQMQVSGTEYPERVQTLLQLATSQWTEKKWLEPINIKKGPLVISKPSPLKKSF